MPQHLENQLCCPLAIGKPSGYWTVRRIRRFGYGASIGLPITNLSDIVPRLRVDVRLPFTNHQSLLTHSTRFACSGRASHLSLFTCHQSPNLSLLTSLSDIALATSDHGRASGLTVRLQDLFLVLSQCVDLGLLSIMAAFGAAGDLKEILGSGFEMIRISQGESESVFRLYDKERSNWRSNSGSQ
jgi:hypothetical protein